MLPEYTIKEYSFSQSMYQPGEPVHFNIVVISSSESSADVSLVVRYMYLNEVIEEQNQIFNKRTTILVQIFRVAAACSGPTWIWS